MYHAHRQTYPQPYKYPLTPTQTLWKSKLSFSHEIDNETNICILQCLGKKCFLQYYVSED